MIAAPARPTDPLMTRLAALGDTDRAKVLKDFRPDELAALMYDWKAWARDDQLAPTGNWRFWLLLAGRGFGKTRVGAEQVIEWARKNVGRIHLIGATAADVRDTMVEGESGILACSPPDFRPTWEPSKRKLTWPNGTVAITFSSETPERLRGPQCAKAWCVSGDQPIVTRRGTMAMRDVRRGDWVPTRQGWRMVTAASWTGHRPTVTITTTSGQSVRCTPDHNVWANGAWCDAQAVTPGSTMLACSVASGTKLNRPIPATATTSDSVHLVTVPVVSVSVSASTDVYDLTIEGAHEFIAGGLLVHNCDELASWSRLNDTWSNFIMGFRLGSNPQCVITTTPRPVTILRRLLARETDGSVAVTRGSTYANVSNLAPGFFEEILDQYEGTTLGLQEIYALLLDENPRALWRRQNILYAGPEHPLPTQFERIVVALDPAVSSDEKSAEFGIVVAGKVGARAYILDDLSARCSPAAWIALAIDAYEMWGADRIIGEANNGGDMIEALLRTRDADVSYKSVHASRGKRTRAEPIAALYEQRRVVHAQTFAALEDQMVNWIPDEPNQASPDRLDACVWALTELMLGHREWSGEDFDPDGFTSGLGQRNTWDIDGDG